MGLISVLGLILVVLLAWFIALFFMALIPITLVGVFLWTGLRWLVGLVWFIVTDIASILQTLRYSLF
jgi:hypothetical protein